MLQPNKVEAIYSLRDAAEQKAKAEMTLRDQPSPQHREQLLDAQIKLEAKTQDAIEACHQCGGKHTPDEPHAASGEKVIEVNFGEEKQP